MKNDKEIYKNKSPKKPKLNFKFKQFKMALINHIKIPWIKKMPKLLSASKVKILDKGFLRLRKNKNKNRVRNTF